MPDPIDKSVLRILLTLPPEKAMQWLAQRDIQPSGDWHEVLDAAHDRAFVIAQMAQTDLLAELKKSLQTALEQGLTLEQWRAQIEPMMQKAGWWGKKEVIQPDSNVKKVQLGSPRRVKLIYEQNMQSAYAAGRRAEMLEAVDTHPYWMYIHTSVSHPRLNHLAMDGRVMRYDDPFWAVGYPPNGFGCKCRVSPLTEGGVARRGITVDSSAGHLTKEIVKVGKDNSGDIYKLSLPDMNQPFTTSVGFNHAPSLTNSSLTDSPTTNLNPLDSKGASSVNKVPLIALPNRMATATKNAEFKDFSKPIINQLPAAGQPAVRTKLTGAMMQVGVMPTDVINALATMGKPLQSSVLTVRDEEIVHALRPQKDHPVDRQWYLDLPEHLAQPDAVLLDTQKDGALLFVYAMPNNMQNKLVVMTNQTVKANINGTREKLVTNIVKTAQVIKTNDLKGSIYKLLFGAVK